MAACLVLPVLFKNASHMLICSTLSNHERALFSSSRFIEFERRVGGDVGG